MSILQRRRSAVVYVAGLVSGLALAALLGLRPWEGEAAAQTESDSNLAANVAELRKSVQNLREKVDSSKEQVATLEELLEDVLLGDIHVGNADKLDGLDSTAFQLKLTAGEGIKLEENKISLDFEALDKLYLSTKGGTVSGDVVIGGDFAVEEKTRLGNFIGRPESPDRGTGIFNGESGRVEFYDGKFWRSL